MKKLLTTLSLLITVFSVNFDAKASVITAIVNGGTWATGTSWDLGRVPECGDTVKIPSGINIRVSANVNLDDGGLFCPAVRVTVGGTLSFASGKKLRLALGACFVVEAGGVVRESLVGAGSSESIDIDGVELWQSEDGPLNGPAFIGCSTLLPVNLLAFNVNQDTESFSLDWKVAQENDLAYYELFVSENGNSWESISKQNAQGTNSNEQSYEYRYIKGLTENKLLYFKLEATTFSGNKTILAKEVVHADLNPLKNDEIRVFPNPFAENDVFNIAFQSSSDEEAALEIMDFSGKIIYSKKINCQEGQNIITLESRELRKGNYFLKLTGSNLTSTQKIVIL